MAKFLIEKVKRGNKDITLKVKFAIELLLLLFVDAVDAVVVVVVV